MKRAAIVEGCGLQDCLSPSKAVVKVILREIGDILKRHSGLGKTAFSEEASDVPVTSKRATDDVSWLTAMNKHGAAVVCLAAGWLSYELDNGRFYLALALAWSAFITLRGGIVGVKMFRIMRRKAGVDDT